MSANRHRLELRCPDGNPNRATIHLDGQQLLFVTRIELDFDCNGSGDVKLTVPTALVDLDVDVAAFVTAHTDGVERDDSDSCAHCGHPRAAHNGGGETGCSECPTTGFAYDHLFDERS